MYFGGGWGIIVMVGTKGMFMWSEALQMVNFARKQSNHYKGLWRRPSPCLQIIPWPSLVQTLLFKSPSLKSTLAVYWASSARVC